MSEMSEQAYNYRKNKYLKEFILLYKNLPCIWNIKSKDYHRRDLRTQAYNELIKKLKEIYPTADRITVVKKINSLRSCLRKEQRKIARLAKEGVVYEPRLWYYPLFDFITGQKRSRVGSSLDNESEEEGTDSTVKMEGTDYEVEYAEDDDDDPLDSYEKLHEDESSRDISSPTPNKATFQTELAQASSSLKYGPEQRTSNILRYEESLNQTSHDDQYDVFGKNVAAKLRDIAYKDNTQRLMAEKIINDALFMAELGQLNIAHCSTLRAE